jgi:signal peptidase II
VTDAAGRLLRRLRLAVPLALLVLTADCTTKQLAVEHLAPHRSRDVVGDVVKLTLAYNDGAAMGLPLGPRPMPLLIGASLLIVLFLLRLLWQSPPADTPRRVALGLLLGGALGNAFSRMFSPLGVVDFINVGLGSFRFYVFNVADIGVVCGAVLLAVVMWRESRPGNTAVT